MKKVVIKIRNCNECPNFRTETVWDSTEKPRRWWVERVCCMTDTKLGDRKHHQDFLDNCPLDNCDPSPVDEI